MGVDVVERCEHLAGLVVHQYERVGVNSSTASSRSSGLTSTLLR